MQSELSIIIVNWNGEKFLPDCLRSVAENPPSIPYEVVVVDNASTDGSTDWLASSGAGSIFPEGVFKLIQSDENLGFGRGINLAAEHADGENLLILNPDTLVKGDAIDRLIDTLGSDSSIGATAPRLLNQDGSLQPSTWYFPATPFKIILPNFGLYRLFPRSFVGRTLLSKYWEHDERREVPIAWAAALMFRTDVFRQLGGFDPEFHMYGEDIDICIRMQRAGYKLVFEPKAEVIHIGGGSSRQKWTQDDIHVRSVEMNRIVEKRHLGKMLFVSNNATRLSVEALRMLVNPFLGRSNSKSARVIRTIIGRGNEHRRK
jgi:GT2 family glycosyltransferase